MAKAKDVREHKRIASKINNLPLSNHKVRPYDPRDKSSGTVLQQTRRTTERQPAQRSSESGSAPPKFILQRSRPGPESRTSPGSRKVNSHDRATGRHANNENPQRNKYQATRQSRNTLRRSNLKRDEDEDDDEDGEEGDDNDDSSRHFDEHMENVVAAQPGLPKDYLPYHPKQPERTELEKDWPNTPMTTSGTIASIAQHLGPMANRQGHTHWTPLQLAKMYLAGQLVSFNSEAEKEETMKFVKQLQDEREAATGKPQGSVPAYAALSSSEKGAAGSVISSMVQGQYPTLEKQQMPWMNTIVRQLRNNETYSPTDSTKFMARIHKLVAEVQKSGQQRRVEK